MLKKTYAEFAIAIAIAIAAVATNKEKNVRKIGNSCHCSAATLRLTQAQIVGSSQNTKHKFQFTN